MDWSEISDVDEYLKLFAGLFALTPPSSFIPVFLGSASRRPRSEQRTMATVAVVAFAIVMITFTFAGEAILDTFGISIAAFRVAGGLLLLLIGLDMMRSPVETEESAPIREGSPIAVALVPLAIPILAGPGAISTVVIYAQQEEGPSHLVLVALVGIGVAAVIYGLLRAAILSGRLFTPTVAVVFNRVMGLIIAAVAVEFIFHGIAGHFPDMRIEH